MRELDIWDDRSERPHYNFPDVGSVLQVSTRSLAREVEVQKSHGSQSAVPIAARKERLQDFPNNAVPSHWHDDVEVVAVRRGDMIYNVNGHTVPMTRGDGIFVNSRQLHFANSPMVRYTSPLAGHSPTAGVMCDCDYICIRMHPSLLCVSGVFKKHFVMPIIESGQAFCLLHSDVKWQKEMLDLTIAMFDIRESSTKCGTAPMKALSVAASIWALLFEHLPRGGDAVSLQDSDLTAVRNMMGYIQQNYADEMSLADIASSGAVGISKCCKLFSKYFAQSPISYLNRHRLSKGAELISGTDKSITEIALAVGFGGASYFSEAFKRWAGESPTEFRKKKHEADDTIRIAPAAVLAAPNQ